MSDKILREEGKPWTFARCPKGHQMVYMTNPMKLVYKGFKSVQNRLICGNHIRTDLACKNKFRGN